MYLNKWSLDFDPNEDIPNAIPVWVKLLRLPLSCGSDDCLCAITNGLGKYMDRAEPKGFQFACANICIEIGLKKGLLSYGICHDNGHYAKHCKKDQAGKWVDTIVRQEEQS